MKKQQTFRAYKGLGTLGDQVEAQFDRMDHNLSQIRPRQINEYNQIVWMTKLLKEVRS